MMRKLLLFFISIAFFCSCGESEDGIAEKTFESYNGNYLIIISKKKFSLSVHKKGEGLVATYRVGIGRNSDLGPKLFEGDNRTPEGYYKVNEILSMDSDRSSGSYRKLKWMNEYYFKKSSGYTRYGDPDLDLGDNVYGPRFYGINYPNENDKKRYQDGIFKGVIPVKNGKPADIGYGIAIHGNNDEKSIGHPCSSGCIRMYNRDVVEIEKYIALDTPVIILNE